MLVYTEHRNARVDYAITTFFRIAGIETIEITNDISKFENENGNKMFYSSQTSNFEFQIVPHKLLFESGVKPQELKMEKWEESFCFFKTSDGKIPFDIFAASFWLLTRYEEYLPFTPDNHSRFSGKDSFLFKNKLLLQPLIDQWGKQLLQMMRINVDRKVKKTLTIDVDNAFAFAHKGKFRSFQGFIRNLATQNFKSIKDRRKVLSGRMHDPFDTYDEIIEKAKNHQIDLKFFFLLGDRARNDTNMSHLIPELREKIKYVSSQAEVGIHPSYNSLFNYEKVKEEVRRLEEIIGKKVTISRQHFLRMQLPKSYQILIQCGITEEHTMGFADEPGYRAGTSQPFYWYDLENEKQTNLLVFPFVMMDATLKRYLGLSPEQAISYSQQIFDEVKKVGGNFTVLWHNETVNDYHKWENWKQVFEAQLKLF